MDLYYCFSSSGGDVPVDEATLARPFMVAPFERHPFMTLRDFFSAIRDFILSSEGQPLVALLSRSRNRPVSMEEIGTITIRYEKYGTLYQIASAEIPVNGSRMKFAVSTAVSPFAQKTLDREFKLIGELNHRTSPSYLPQAYYIGTTRVEQEKQTETLTMTLSEWFDDYHEWHFSSDDEESDRIVIWDMGGGNRFASESESYEIIRQASRILTLYYDAGTYCRVAPWHHGGGDFIVRTGAEGVTVKLVTARGYDPLASLSTQKKINPYNALLLFFLELTLKMRLDKLEGMGETTWAGASVVKAAYHGFMQALKIKEEQEEWEDVEVENFTALLLSLRRDEVEKLIRSHLDEYVFHDTSDYRAVMNHLERHAADLCAVIEGLSFTDV
ncbi:MAG: hypothetical protein A4E63_01089 [Syntrophorhabdus sp. PtaU1.Bin050]|nr:MAG: hypothetical protein A4E63_01089 [Syntrophorhabdus sp. PtaU1.Bin050]